MQQIWATWQAPGCGHKNPDPDSGTAAKGKKTSVRALRAFPVPATAQHPSLPGLEEGDRYHGKIQALIRGAPRRERGLRPWGSGKASVEGRY